MQELPDASAQPSAPHLAGIPDTWTFPRGLQTLVKPGQGEEVIWQVYQPIHAVIHPTELGAALNLTMVLRKNLERL